MSRARSPCSAPHRGGHLDEDAARRPAVSLSLPWAVTHAAQRCRILTVITTTRHASVTRATHVVVGAGGSRDVVDGC